jgi:hypothetical protein
MKQLEVHATNLRCGQRRKQVNAHGHAHQTEMLARMQKWHQLTENPMIVVCMPLYRMELVLVGLFLTIYASACRIVDL